MAGRLARCGGNPAHCLGGPWAALTGPQPAALPAASTVTSAAWWTPERPWGREERGSETRRGLSGSETRDGGGPDRARQRDLPQQGMPLTSPAHCTEVDRHEPAFFPCGRSACYWRTPTRERFQLRRTTDSRPCKAPGARDAACRHGQRAPRPADPPGPRGVSRQGTAHHARAARHEQAPCPCLRSACLRPSPARQRSTRRQPRERLQGHPERRGLASLRVRARASRRRQGPRRARPPGRR
jgi:hypothetical protein